MQVLLKVGQDEKYNNICLLYLALITSSSLYQNAQTLFFFIEEGAISVKEEKSLTRLDFFFLFTHCFSMLIQGILAFNNSWENDIIKPKSSHYFISRSQRYNVTLNISLGGLSVESMDSIS